MKKKISIITVVKNGMPYLVDCIKSFQNQKYENKEHIILVSKCNDNTVDYLRKNKFKNTKIFFFKKDIGLYKSLNEAVKFCKGYIIGYLHSDDVFFNNKILNVISNNISEYDYTYGNILFVRRNNLDIKVRSWNYGAMNPLKKRNYLVPPHTSMFFRREILIKSKYNQNYKISSDFDFLIRIMHNKKLNGKYINKYICKMRYGGKSTKIKFLLTKIIEDHMILKKYNKFPIYIIVLKYFIKFKQFIF